MRGFSECAEEDSNLHGPYSPQGPQPCASILRPRCAGGGIGRRARLRALCAVWPVEVRVLFGVLGEAPHTRGFSALGAASAIQPRQPCSSLPTNWPVSGLACGPPGALLTSLPNDPPFAKLPRQLPRSAGLPLFWPLL